MTNGALENNVFFENNSSKYFMSQQTKADGTLTSLEELYRTDSLDLEFDGWYTEDNEKVTLETVFTEYTILYDRWKETTLTDEDIISTLEINTPLLEVGKLAGTYNTNGITLTDNRLSVEGVSVYEGLNAYRTNKLDDSDVLEAGKSYSLRVELHTKNGELIDDLLMNHSTATYGLVANMLYSHDNSGIFTTQWTNRENKIQVIINYDFENYCFTSDLEDKVVENGQSPQYTVYVSNNANIQGMELFVKNANDTWASLGAVTGQFNIPENSNVVKQYRVEVTYQNGFVIIAKQHKGVTYSYIGENVYDGNYWTVENSVKYHYYKSNGTWVKENNEDASTRYDARINFLANMLYFVDFVDDFEYSESWKAYEGSNIQFAIFSDVVGMETTGVKTYDKVRLYFEDNQLARIELELGSDSTYIVIKYGTADFTVPTVE